MIDILMTHDYLCVKDDIIDEIDTLFLGIIYLKNDIVKNVNKEQKIDQIEFSIFIFCFDIMIYRITKKAVEDGIYDEE